MAIKAESLDAIAGSPFNIGRDGARRIKTRAVNVADAARAVEGFEPGVMMTGITKGAFSMLDLIEAIVAETGPADVDVSTWTTGIRGLKTSSWPRVRISSTFTGASSTGCSRSCRR